MSELKPYQRIAIDRLEYFMRMERHPINAIVLRRNTMTALRRYDFVKQLEKDMREKLRREYHNRVKACLAAGDWLGVYFWGAMRDR